MRMAGRCERSSRVNGHDRCRRGAVGLSVTLLLSMGAAGCLLGDEQVVEAPVRVEARALSGTSCGDDESPTPGVNPFTDITSLTVAVRRFDTTSGRYETTVRESASLGGAGSVRIRNVPEGLGQDVIALGRGGQGDWYARDADVSVLRNTDNVIGLLFTRYGGLSCVPTPETTTNTVFPASAVLGDGRVLVTGGFARIEADQLTDASNNAFLFDPRTGEVENLGSMGSGQGRGGHAMVYLPASDRVLIIGGLTRLRLDEDREFPFVFSPSDRDDARDDYVVFDVASKTFTPGVDRMSVKRAFPRLHLLADGTALITGGGPWPFDLGEPGYLQVDIYDPERDGGAGGLLDVRNFRSFHTRSGHSLTFLQSTAEGLSQLLVWGGTTPERSFFNPAEVFVQSGRQRDGINGTFREVTIYGQVPNFNYFHETTPLTGRRFLVTGGAVYDGGAMRAPRDDEAWLLRYVDEPGPGIVVERVPGIGAGRVFHSAFSSDGVNVTIAGGLGGLDAIATDRVMLFDLGDPGQPWRAAGAGTSGAFGPRGGATAAMLPSGAALLVGGQAAIRPQSTVRRAIAEVFTPPNLPEP